MATVILKVLLEFLVIQGIFSKSIQNATADENKLITVETFEAWTKNMTDYVTDLFKKESNNQKKHVYFYAKMQSSDITLNKNSIVKFSTVISNEGNHFTPGDSIFISPVSGVYLFSWTTQTYSGKTVSTELRVNNNVKDGLHANLSGSVGRLSITRVAICKVSKNEHVWIQTSRHFTENFFEYDYNSGSTFMGVLLYEI